MAYGIMGASPDMIAQQRRITSLPADPKETALAQYITRLAQQNKMGTPEYFMAAGEFTKRQQMRQEQATKQQEQPPVVAEINALAAQKAMPVDRGVAALPVQNVGNYAMGGIVSFEDGGEVQRYQNRGFVQNSGPIGFTTAMSGNPMDIERARAYYISNKIPLPYELMTEEERGKMIDPNFSRRARAAIEQIPGAPAMPTVATTPTTTATDVAQMTPPAAPATKVDTAGIATIAPANYKRLMEQAGEMATGIMGQRPTVPTGAEAVNEIKDVYRQAGVNFDLFKEQMAKLEEEGKAAKGDRQEAMNMRLIEAGLGVLGGESPYAFVNIGKGASPALKGLQDDFKDLKKLERDRQKAMRDLQVAENQLSAGVGGDAFKRRDAAEKRLDNYNEREAVIKNSMFNTMTSAETQREVANLSSRTTMAKEAGDRADQNKLRAYQEANKEMMKMMTVNPLLAQDPVKYEEEFNKVYQRALQFIETGKLGTGSTGGGGLVRNPDGTFTYQPKK